MSHCSRYGQPSFWNYGRHHTCRFSRVDEMLKYLNEMPRRFKLIIAEQTEVVLRTARRGERDVRTFGSLNLKDSFENTILKIPLETLTLITVLRLHRATEEGPWLTSSLDFTLSQSSLWYKVKQCTSISRYIF